MVRFSRTLKPRTLRPRTTLVKSTSRTGERPKSIIAIKKQQQAEAEFLKDLKQQTGEFILSVPNINDLSKEARNFYRTNVAKVPPKFDSFFRSFINEAISQAKTNQTKRISELKRKISFWQRYADRYDKRGERAKELDYETRISEARQYLDKLEKGQVLNVKGIISFANKQGKIKLEEIKKKERATVKL